MPRDLAELHAVAHYELLGLVGQGGMGRVYRARDRNLERQVALKFLTPRLLDSSEARERFAHEARTISALNHPNIAVIYSIEEFEGEPFLALEFLGGGTLGERIAHGPLPYPQIAHLCGCARKFGRQLRHTPCDCPPAQCAAKRRAARVSKRKRRDKTGVQ